MPISISRQEKILIDNQDYTPQSTERQENISINRRKSEVTAEPVLFTDVENVENTL